MVSRDPFNTQLRSFCHHLWTYFHNDEAGMLHKKLLDSEVKSKLKGKIYNTGFVGDAYEDANEAREKRQKIDLKAKGTGYSQSSMSSQVSSPSKTKKLAPLESWSEMPSLTEGPSSEKSDVLTSTSPLGQEEYQVAAMARLNQKVQWKVGDLDLLAKFDAFRSKPQSPFSLALDDIADVSIGSEFASELSQDERKLANFALSELFR
ncbi:hypothetical protein BGZ93_001679 [Podila epicladia]|nr:hypothetical protein BGZ93_001679 [Podila epicladia]